MYLIPKPREIVQSEGFFTMEFDGRILIDSSCGEKAYEYACLLKEEMEASMGFGLSITRGASDKKGVLLQEDPSLGQEEYLLKISKDGVRITGGTERGLLYGVQTLRQILRQEGMCLPHLTVRDYPSIEKRGYHYDVTRGRIPTLSYLKKLVDRMAFYKMNQLQLYIEHSFLFEGMSEVWRDDTPLTAEDIMELDAYCRRLNIELVPSISCFGHLYKVLSTTTYAHLCELPGAQEQPFSLVGRMAHHTIDVTNEESFRFIQKRIEDFIPLFTSEYFNIGADETFDLGKGRSKELADREGTDRIYLDFVKRICQFLVEKGKRPMFWGDIICEFPDAIKELPSQTICLNWGYDRNQSDEPVRKLAQAGAVQYVCPGVNGWNQFVADLEAAYENTRRMCVYAISYDAEGVLLTEWGDYGHINHPELEIPGMIYGAAFSWNPEIPDFESINRSISRVEYDDRSEKLVNVIAQIAPCWTFDWRAAVRYKEGVEKCFPQEWTAGKETVDRLKKIREELGKVQKKMPSGGRQIIYACLVGMRGMELFERVGAILGAGRLQTEPANPDKAGVLACELEEWFLFYKQIWRSIGREGELFRIQDVVFWYADLLRQL